MDDTTWRRAAHGPEARRRQELAQPGARPDASWVMGRAARWHDPDVAAELRMHELAEEYRDTTLLGAAAGSGSRGALLRGIWRGLRALRRPCRR